MIDTGDVTAGQTVGWRHAVAFGVAVLLALAAWAVLPVARSATEVTAYCDTSRSSIRCYPDGVGNPYVVVHRDGLWQDAGHAWRRGVPECLSWSGDSVGPVTLGLVSGGDDGMSWETVAWVGCP